jgi:transposase-like protein
VKEKKIQKKYEEEFKRQAVELVIHSGKTQAQIARGFKDYGTSLISPRLGVIWFLILAMPPGCLMATS